MSKRYTWNAKTPLPEVKFKADMTTTDEVDLFAVPDTALARLADPASSHEGKHAVDAEHLSRLVVDTLRAYGPLTCEEIAARLNMSDARDSISPRLKPLVVAGLIENSGTKRKSSRGVNVIVWQIPEKKQ